jgi:hypothetical protein
VAHLIVGNGMVQSVVSKNKKLDVYKNNGASISVASLGLSCAVRGELWSLYIVLVSLCIKENIVFVS